CARAHSGSWNNWYFDLW
nr:immunoglobulin heavy chain junction region [Macaca mulatta]MOX59524.1 immunoglobulin heavy chain junction region [Macaca mulatta]MOX62091.1 immunoglobulin heavy chain junction region [Macaca mulatta]MOX62156.1 immunoglobulin heavy chain junction region [Macaca mulatta]MOX62373.1 immunoglobulin heavy chain junction region [Macaca mulatta]